MTHSNSADLLLLVTTGGLMAPARLTERGTFPTGLSREIGTLVRTLQRVIWSTQSSNLAMPTRSWIEG